MVTHIRLMDVGGYRHNNKGFCKNFTFLKSINRGRTTIVEVHNASLVELLLSLLFLS